MMIAALAYSVLLVVRYPTRFKARHDEWVVVYLLLLAGSLLLPIYASTF
jgi:hypothetical protein